ncbi:MAG: ParB/RepB/Spo0J family partition protein [Oryzomonas sp.]
MKAPKVSFGKLDIPHLSKDIAGAIVNTTTSAAAMPDATFAYITLDKLSPNDYNARRFFDNMTPQRQARFDELVASVREKRIIEPLLVRPLADGRFEVIAGERRYRGALKVVGTTTAGCTFNYQVPCMIRDVDDDDAFDLMVIENLQREDLSPLETAQAFAAYLERHGNTPEATDGLALRTGIPAHAIRRMVRLLEVPAEVISAWKDGVITQTHVEMFTRIGDHQQILELLEACRRSKLSTRELAERIGAVMPDLERGFFDRAECVVCHYNTSVQSGLFADAAQGGKCGNPSCFEAKQAAFLTENWPKSKAAEAYGTNGFKFGHRMDQVRCDPIMLDVVERCFTCDRFITVLRLTGAVVSGYSRTCTGPLICFDELYRNPPGRADVIASTENDCRGDANGSPASVGQPKTSTISAVATCIGCGCDDNHACAGDGGPCSWIVVDRQTGKGVCSECEGSMEEWNAHHATKSTPSTKSTSSTKATKSAVPETIGPVFNAPRGEKFREAFLRTELPSRIDYAPVDSPNSLRLVLLALILASPAAKKNRIAALGFSDTIKPPDLAQKIFEIAPDDSGRPSPGRGKFRHRSGQGLVPDQGISRLPHLRRACQCWRRARRRDLAR